MQVDHNNNDSSMYYNPLTRDESEMALPKATKHAELTSAQNTLPTMEHGSGERRVSTIKKSNLVLGDLNT